MGHVLLEDHLGELQGSHLVLEGLGISWRRWPGFPAGIVAPATRIRRGPFVQKADFKTRITYVGLTLTAAEPKFVFLHS